MLTHFRAVARAALVLIGITGSAVHGQTADTIVVLDVSGSMWGQIDGRTKIEIARDAFADLSRDWASAGVQPGLIAYGHRRKGDCRDIELLASPQEQSAQALSDTVNTLTPKGKTPLSDSVRMAAEELKFTENAANVILLSDGRETCDADPCAVSTELEALGIDFTAHVIGFDITDEEARSQLQCVAQNTGGQYLDANNADQLRDAFRAIPIATQATPTVTETRDIAFNVQVAEQDGTSRPDQLSVRATNLKSGDIIVLGTLAAAQQVIEGLDTQLPIGDWKIELISSEGRGAIDVSISEDTDIVYVPFAANEVVFGMRDTGPYQLGITHQFYLDVTGNLQPNATYTVSLFPAGAVEFKERLDWESRFGSDATGITLHDFASPDAAGAYEILITRSYELSEAIARFPVTYAEDVAPTWQGATQGQPGEAIPIILGGNLGRYGELSLSDNGRIITTYPLSASFGPEGPMLTLPEMAGAYDLNYEYALPEGGYETSTLAKLTVGPVVVADDLDAVEPPVAIQEGLSADNHVWEPMNIPVTADPELLRLNEGDGFVFHCRAVTCSYDDPVTGLNAIPLLGDFALLEPILNEGGRPTIELINEFTGEWVVLNPFRQTDQTTDCVDIGLGGPSVTTPDTAIDLLCAVKGGNGYTFQMMETLGAWASDRNAAGAPQGEAADTMMSPEEAAAEAALLAKPHPLETLLRTWTVIDPTDILPVGHLKFTALDPDNVSAVFWLQNGAKLDLEEQRIEATQVDVVKNGTGQITLITLMLPTLGLVQIIPDDLSDPKNPIYQGILLNPNKGHVLNVKVI